MDVFGGHRVYSKTAISILEISNHNSFRVVFDKNASVYFIWRTYLNFSIGNVQPREPAQCQLYRHTIVLCRIKVLQFSGLISRAWNATWKITRSVLFFSRPCPHHGRTFSICLCPLSSWLTISRPVLPTSWCCSSRPCVAFLAFVHLALFLALSLSPGNSLVSSWCDRSILASLLWRCLAVPSLLHLC